MNILAALSEESKAELEMIIMECILSTDPGLHTEFVKRLSVSSPFLSEQRLLIMQCIIKMADNSNVAHDWDGPSYRWSCLVSQEFFSQGDALKSYSMNLAMFLDRDATTVGRTALPLSMWLLFHFSKHSACSFQFLKKKWSPFWLRTRKSGRMNVQKCDRTQALTVPSLCIGYSALSHFCRPSSNHFRLSLPQLTQSWSYMMASCPCLCLLRGDGGCCCFLVSRIFGRTGKQLCGAKEFFLTSAAVRVRWATF